MNGGSGRLGPRARRRRRLVLPVLLAVLLVAGLGYAAWWPSATWFGPVVVAGPAASGRVALTFDDGPDPEVTPLVLDRLREHGARATFFVLGERALSHPELVRRIHDEGHALGNHSFSHPPLPLRATATIQAELERTQEAIAAAAGVRARWFRPPYGLRDPRVHAAADALDMTTVLWSLSPRDWQDPEPEVVVTRTLQSIRGGDIVLLHDGAAGRRSGRTSTARALGALLEGLAERGLRAVPLDELLDSPTGASGASAAGDAAR